jgi:type II secretory ATPase GspE/PulE/Tfp pilus assembly ATPase PilB-like protein
MVAGLPDPAGVDAALFALMPLHVAQSASAVPVALDGTTVVIAMADPDDFEAVDEVSLALHGRELTFVAVPRSYLDLLLVRWSRVEVAESTAAAATEIAELSSTVTSAADADSDDDGQTARLVVTLLDAAAEAGASDVHLEPMVGVSVVRIRVDGVLREHARLQPVVAAGVVNRLKVLGKLNLSERRMPQSGRFEARVAHGVLDCRLETVPTAWGTEGAVIRLFDRSKSTQSLPDLGFSAGFQGRLLEALAHHDGAILVAGPTGSGKTRTLYAALDLVATAGRKTLTVEDPVEIRRDTVTQVQVNDKAGLSFATALRSFLRSDPDVILVGEIRDGETAELASRAAMTGHLVLTTVHANSAAAAPGRLFDLGLEASLVSDTVRAVLAQRLMRRVCPACSTLSAPTRQELDRVKWASSGLPVPDAVRRAGDRSCVTCLGQGYSGRFAVGELILVDDQVADAIARRATARELHRISVAAGTVSMRDDALAHIAAGHTTFDELTRAGV